jgi:hypothetical protein
MRRRLVRGCGRYDLLRRITDSDVQILASCAATLEEDYSAEDKEWDGSPFAWIKTRPSRQIGVIGEKLVAGWLATKGFDVTRSPDSDADRIINGVRAEIKFSTIWKGGFYKFQQLRKQNYDFAICLGVRPFDAHCWVISKEEIVDQWGAGNGLAAQHGGQRGQDTAWLTVCPDNVPAWLNLCGGTLADAAECITSLTGREPL